MLLCQRARERIRRGRGGGGSEGRKRDGGEAADGRGGDGGGAGQYLKKRNDNEATRAEQSLFNPCGLFQAQ